MFCIQIVQAEKTGAGGGHHRDRLRALQKLGERRGFGAHSEADSDPGWWPRGATVLDETGEEETALGGGRAGAQRKISLPPEKEVRREHHWSRGK